MATTLKDTLAAYTAARRELTEFDAEYGPIFETRNTLESAVKEAQAAMTNELSESGIDFIEDDDFAVTLVQQDRGSYLVERLPSTRAVLDRCVMTISAGDVKKLVRKGELTQAQADAAWESKPVKPYVKVTIKTNEGRD